MNESALPMLVPVAWYQVLAAVLFAIGAMGVLFRRNILVIFMCVELMLNATNIAFVAFARHLGSLDGQIIVFFVLAVAAAEVSVGLAIIIDVFRKRGTVDLAAARRVNLPTGLRKRKVAPSSCAKIDGVSLPFSTRAM